MSDLIALLDATLRLISNNNNNSNGSGTTAAAAAERKKLSRLSVHGVKPGGYPVEMFLDGLSQQETENYQCGICFLIAKNPCHCLNRHQFCRSCVTVWAGSGESENHNKCPVCRVKGYYLPSGRVADALNSMTVRCLLRSCVWTGQLRDMQYHRHILSKKIAEESSCRVYRKNSSTSDESSESDTCESQTPSPSSSPVLPRITASSKHVTTTVPVSGATPLSVRLSGHEWDSVRPPASNATFLQLLHSASSSVDMPPRDTSQNGQSVSDSVFSASTMVVPDSADLAPEVRCCTPRPRSSTPTTNLRSSTQLPASVIVINNNNNSDNNNNNNNMNNNNSNNNNNNIINNNIVNRTAASNYNANTFGPTAGFSVRSAVAPRTSNAGSENSLPSLNPEQQPEPVYCRGSTRRTGPKEYERLRARMRETRVRLEQMEITRRELARFQERQRRQHLVEVRELGRQLNEVTFQIRRLLNQMSTADDSTTASTSTTTRTNHRNSNDDN